MPYVILGLNNKLDQNTSCGVVYKPDRRKINSYSENTGIVYLDRNAFIVQNTSNKIGHIVVID